MVEGMDHANGWHASFSENVPISVPIVVGTLDKNDPERVVLSAQEVHA